MPCSLTHTGRPDPIKEVTAVAREVCKQQMKAQVHGKHGWPTTEWRKLLLETPIVKPVSLQFISLEELPCILSNL